MAASEENSALFPIFILTIMAIPLVPYTMVKLSGALSKKQRTIHCQCLECDRSGKYKRSLFKKVTFHSTSCSVIDYCMFLTSSSLIYLQISNFSTWSNLTLVLLWVVMIFLIYYTKNMSREVIPLLAVELECTADLYQLILLAYLPSFVLQAQVFDPFSILGLEPGVTDSEIKKAYRRLSIQYHPDKNPDPGQVFPLVIFFFPFDHYGIMVAAFDPDSFFFYAHLLISTEANKYFVEFISKAYQALTDSVSRENFEKYGHPDGRQVRIHLLSLRMCSRLIDKPIETKILLCDRRDFKWALLFLNFF